MASRSKTSVPPNLKNLKIKTGVCKRLIADLKLYSKEEAEQQAKVAKMKTDGADPYDIKKQEEVLGETIAMIPDTKNRLRNAYDELCTLIDTCASDESVISTQEWTDAQTMKNTLSEMFDV